MSHIIHLHSVLALLPRVFLGMLFLFQGYDAVFRVKVSGVIGAFDDALTAKGIPIGIIRLGAYFTSYVQLIGGAFLIIGFLKYYVLYFLGLDLLLATFAFGLLKPMWDLGHVFPRMALLLFLLMIPPFWDVFSVDYAWSLIRFIHSFSQAAKG